MKWENIKRNSSPEVISLDSKTGLQQVLIPLNQEPPREWIGRFMNSTSKDTSFSVPEIRGSAVHLNVREKENELEKAVAYVDTKIREANEQFVQHDLPGIQAKEANEHAAKTDEADRLKVARDKAAKLKPKEN